MPIDRTRKGDEAKRLRKLAGQWLKAKRAAAGLTQKELATRVGLEYYTFVSQIEGGQGRVPPNLYPVWAQTLGLDVKEFAKKMLEFYDPHIHRALGFSATETENNHSPSDSSSGSDDENETRHDKY